MKPTSLWEATLRPASQQPDSNLPTITGQVAIAVHGGFSRIGIGVEGADRDLYWGVFNGTCSDPGARLLDASMYAVIPPTMTELEVGLNFTLDPTRQYHVRMGADSAMEVSLACGDLVQRPI